MEKGLEPVPPDFSPSLLPRPEPCPDETAHSEWAGCGKRHALAGVPPCRLACGSTAALVTGEPPSHVGYAVAEAVIALALHRLLPLAEMVEVIVRGTRTFWGETPADDPPDRPEGEGAAGPGFCSRVKARCPPRLPPPHFSGRECPP